MTITSSSLWKFAAVLILAAASAGLYLRLVNPEKSFGNLAAPAKPANSLTKLAALVDAQAESICAPTAGAAPASARQEFLLLRQELSKSLSNIPATAQTGYRCGIQLCDTLLLAIQEREQAGARLASTNPKPHAATMARDSEKEIAERDKFFETSSRNLWSDKAKSYRAQVANLRTRLATEIKRAAPIAVASATSAEPGSTIVLQHPTLVRLKYGSATLPAGLSLRVLNRTSNGVAVDYAGEQVTVPLP